MEVLAQSVFLLLCLWTSSGRRHSRRLFRWGHLSRKHSLLWEVQWGLTLPGPLCPMQESKVCAICLHGVRKTLSKVNRKTHPALLEREFQELLTHSFHYSAFPLIGSILLFCEVFQILIFLASHMLQGQEGTCRTTWCGQAHLLQMWAAGGHSIQCSCRRSRSCKAAAKPSRSLGQEVAHSSLTTLVSPHTTKGGLNLSQMSTYHSLLFLPGNHRKIYLSKERGSKGFNSALMQLASGLLPYVAIYQAVWVYRSGSPGILGWCYLTLLQLGSGGDLPHHRS